MSDIAAVGEKRVFEPFDKEAFKKEILNNIKYLFRKTPETASQQEIFHIRQVCRFHPMFCTGIRIAVPGMESSRAIPVYAIEDLQQEQKKHSQNCPQSASSSFLPIQELSPPRFPRA